VKLFSSSNCWKFFGSGPNSRAGCLGYDSRIYNVLSTSNVML